MSTDGAEPRGARASRRWALTFLAWSSLTVLWSLSVGLGGSPDEPAHMVKAAATANGQFTTAVEWGAGAFGSEVPRTPVRVPEAFASLHHDRTCWTGDTAVPASCMPRPGGSRAHDTDASTYVGTYPPVYYLAVGWPAQVLAPPGSMYAMRMASALLAAAFLTEGFVTSARRGRSRLGLAGAALAMPASMLLLGSTVNPNGLEVASAFCLWASMLALVDGRGPRSRRDLVAATVAALVLTWLRPLGPALALLIMGLALISAPDAASLRSLRAGRTPRLATATLAVSALAAVAFAASNRSYNSLITYSGLGERSLGDAARDATAELVTFLLRSWDLLGWQGADTLTVPRWITWPWLAMVAGVALTAMWVGTTRTRLALSSLVIGCVLGPIVPSMTSPATPWQGRYMLPLLVGIPLLSTAIIERSGSSLVDRIPRRASATVLIVCSGSYLVAHQHLMNRTVVGLPARPLANLTSGTWEGPLTPTVLFVWAALASIAWVAALLHSFRIDTAASHSSGPDDPRSDNDDPAIRSP